MATTVDGTAANGISPELLAKMNPKKKGSDSVQDQQDRFMTLLVTQMKNQDPLNPMDNAAVTSQFAQLSTVTGINKLNDALQALQGSYSASQTLQATSLIGRGVLAPGSSVQLAGGKAILGVEFTEPADHASIAIKNAAGKTVRTIDLGSNDAGTVPLVWDGKTDAGETAPDGAYTFTVDATRGDAASKATRLSFGAVSSVTTGSSGIKLNVPGVGELSMSDVREIM